MTQLFPRLIRAAIGASALATAMSLQSLTAAPATGQTRPVPAANASNGKREVRQDDAKEKSDKAKGDKAKSDKGDEAKKKWTKSERKELVKRAQVWAPTNIPSM